MPCRILIHFMKCPKTCLFLKLVKYTRIISSDPIFKEGHAWFPMEKCISLNDWGFENTSVFLSCKCMLDMPLHKWKVTWNYVSSPFQTHKSNAKNFHSQKLKTVKNNNIITSLNCIFFYTFSKKHTSPEAILTSLKRPFF